MKISNDRSNKLFASSVNFFIFFLVSNGFLKRDSKVVMSNCSLFGINVFINVIKRRCDNREKKKKQTIEKERRRKKTDIETDGTGSGR